MLISDEPPLVAFSGATKNDSQEGEGVLQAKQFDDVHENRIVAPGELALNRSVILRTDQPTHRIKGKGKILSLCHSEVCDKKT